MWKKFERDKKAVSGRTVKRYPFFTAIIEPHN